MTMGLFKRKRPPAPSPAIVRTVFRKYEIPAGRTPESFAYRIDFWWGHVIDTCYTDQQSELVDIIAYGNEELYDVTVTHRDGTVESFPAEQA